MEPDHTEAGSIDPNALETWQFACRDCGKPFRGAVSSCPNCDSADAAPIELVHDSASSD